jgi:Protein of unknown function (DUF742)
MTGAIADERPGGRFVRPYAVTRGRTRSRGDELLPIETLVVSKESARARTTGRAHVPHQIFELCTTMHSIAEISAVLDLPLGSVRVVVGDMAVDGFVDVHRPQTGESDGPDIQLLERVLNGLESL